MSNLISNKNFFTFFLFVILISLSYAVSANNISQHLKSCKKSFKNVTNGTERVHNLSARLDRVLEEEKIWLHQHPILSWDLHEFRIKLDYLLNQEFSFSDSLRIQEKLDGLVLPWIFWKSINPKFFISIKDPDKDLKKNIQEWVELSLGRTLNEVELQALEEAYNYTVKWDIMVDIQYFTKQKILKAAGFSERDLDQLGQKTPFRGNEKVSLQIPQRTSTEAHLKAKGYNPAYTRGMDAIEELVAVGKQLREKSVNPYTTHIPYFAKKLREYITYMETGINNSIQREQFELLKKYTEIIIKEEGVTYEQWIAISLRLPDILSNEKPDIIDPSIVQELLKLFPETIVLPTTIGEIGIIPLNTIRSERIEPIGLVTSKRVVDGKEEVPLGFAFHDILHIWASDGVEARFYSEIAKRRDSLSVEKGQNVELAYHILTHETSTGVIISYLTPETFRRTTFLDNPKKIEDNIKTELRPLISEVSKGNDHKGLIDLSGGIDQAIQTIVNDFKQIFDEIQNK